MKPKFVLLQADALRQERERCSRCERSDFKLWKLSSLCHLGSRKGFTIQTLRNERLRVCFGWVERGAIEEFRRGKFGCWMSLTGFHLWTAQGDGNSFQLPKLSRALTVPQSENVSSKIRRSFLSGLSDLESMKTKWTDEREWEY